eukprot:gene51715-15304_t
MFDAQIEAFLMFRVWGTMFRALPLWLAVATPFVHAALPQPPVEPAAVAVAALIYAAAAQWWGGWVVLFFAAFAGIAGWVAT